jgi:hypothetical protein
MSAKNGGDFQSISPGSLRMLFEMTIGAVVTLAEGLQPSLKFILCSAEAQAHLPVEQR